MRCSHCGGNIIRDAFNDETCLQCGRKPARFVYAKRSIDHQYTGKQYRPKTFCRFGICKNCGREKYLVGHGLCAYCRTAVYNKRYGHNIQLKRGTPEYKNALKAAREELELKFKKVA